MRVGDRHWLERLVLRASGSVSVVEPKAVAETVSRTARQALAAYT
jgi:predicted DNA-binding transcriptional regulator YafY